VCTGRDSREHKARQMARSQLQCAPQILELTDAHGAGVAADVVGTSLRVRLRYTESSVKTIECPAAELTVGQWTLVSLVHASKGALSSTAELRVYIDGEVKHREPNARLPPLKHDFVNNTVGKGQTLSRHGRLFDVSLRIEVGSFCICHVVVHARNPFACSVL
jgi:hypothetical protein